MSHALVICLDALRPDAPSAQTMPNLHALKKRAITFSRHRAVFPSDTRPNAATFVTGADCADHGIMGNAFQLDMNGEKALVDTGSAEEITAFHQMLPDGIFTAQTLSEILAKHDLTLSVVSSASTGTTRLLNHDPDLGAGHITLHCHDQTASFPNDLADKIGPPPPENKPDLAAIEYGIDAFLDVIWPQNRPNICLFWFNEPDVSYHAFGPRADETSNALRELDKQFGRLLEWWQAQEPMPLLLLSDHGQVDTDRPIDVVSEMRQAGFEAGLVGKEAAPIQIVRGSFVQIHCEQVEQHCEIVRWLDNQDWCGLIFSQHEIEGTFAFDAVGYQCLRTADIAFTFRTVEKDGRTATPYFASKALRGTHGGLAQKEMEATLLIAPDQSAVGVTSDIPSSTADVLPTLCALLGLPVPESGVGRSLLDPETQTPTQEEWQQATHQTQSARRRQDLSFLVSGARRIVDFGTAEPD